ncbi:hypothetical protein BGLA2_2340007 [Burkholderia gladioli]|nr:hypothetical protein BGLA2_2340007 [Burkholderia gladioli]
MSSTLAATYPFLVNMVFAELSRRSRVWSLLCSRVKRFGFMARSLAPIGDRFIFASRYNCVLESIAVSEMETKAFVAVPRWSQQARRLRPPFLMRLP